jgi:tetratricopeptide (TPR) repeat protein
MKKGLVLLKKAINIDPTNYHALTLLGRVYLTLLNPTKAKSYLTKSLGYYKNQPVAIALIAIWYALMGDMKVSYKILEKAIKENRELKNDPQYAILLPTVRAIISYQYEREKKGFNAYYEKYKMVASIGNGSKITMFYLL